MGVVLAAVREVSLHQLEAGGAAQKGAEARETTLVRKTKPLQQAREQWLQKKIEGMLTCARWVTWKNETGTTVVTHRMQCIHMCCLGERE